MTSRSNSRKLEVRIASDARQFDRGFQQAQRRVQGFDKQMDTAARTGVGRFNSSLDVSAQKLRGLVGVIAGFTAGRALIGWANEARESANNLTESINAITVVAGEGADQILAFGEKAAESAGLANSAANQLVVPIVSMLRNFGFGAEEAGDAAVVLTQRAADMASVFNVDVAQALEAIQAALRGESDPIERFGGSITAARVESFLLAEGIAESKAEITDADKVMGRYKLILEDTARVAGDFAATADEDANKTRIFQARVEDLQAEIGKGLLPAFGSLLDTGEDLLPVLESLGTDVLPVLVEGFADFVAGVGAIIQGIGGLPAGVKIASGALLGLLGTAKLLYAHPVIAGLGLVTAGIIAIGDAARDEKAQVEELTVAIETLAETGDDSDVLAAIRADITGAIKESQELYQAFRELKLPLDDLTGFVVGDPAAIARVTEAVQRFRDTATTTGRLDPFAIGQSQRASGLLNLLESQRQRYEDVYGEVERLRRAERDLNDEGELADKITRQRAQAEADLADARDDVDSTEHLAALEEENARTNELIGGVRELATAYAKDLNKAVSEYLTIFEGVEEVDPIQGVDQLLTNVEGRIEVVSGFLAGLQRLRDEGLFELSFQFEEAGASAQNVAELEGVIADIDRGGATAFELEETLQAAREETGRITEHMGLELARSKLPLLTEAQRLGVEIGEAIAGGVENVAMSFRIRVGASSVVNGPSGAGRTGGNPNTSITAMAEGGRFRPGETLLVGEYRPEVVQFDRGGTVHPSVDQFLSALVRPPAGSPNVTNNWSIALEGTGDPQTDAQRVGAVHSVLARMEAI